jgi:hypothetical protein
MWCSFVWVFDVPNGWVAPQDEDYTSEDDAVANCYGGSSEALTRL